MSNSTQLYGLDQTPERKKEPITNVLSYNYNNNTSTIDTIIERERDSSFLERLDKQNR